RRINRNASALKHPIRRTTLLNQRSNRTTSISHHRTNLRIRLQQRRHIRNKPIHTLTSLIKFHMPQTIITLPSKRNRRPLHIRRNLNPERKPINSNRKLITSIKPQLRRNHRRRTSGIPNPQSLTRERVIRPQQLPHPQNRSIRSSVRERRVSL